MKHAPRWLVVFGVLAMIAGLAATPVRGLPAQELPPVLDDDDDPLPGQPGAGVKPAPKAPAIFKGMVIGCLGDEWTVPNPAEKMMVKSFPMALQTLLDAKYGPGFVRVIPAGQAGASVADYDLIYKAQLQKLKPDVVIIQDSGEPININGFKLKLDALVAKIKENRTETDKIPKVVLLGVFHDLEVTSQRPQNHKEFTEKHNWEAHNAVLEACAKKEKGIYRSLRMVLGNGYGVLKELNYTRPFREDGLVPTYVGATLVAMDILDGLGEDLNNYNYRDLDLSEAVRTALIGLVKGRKFVNGKPIDDEAEGPGEAVAAELKKFDEALRIQRRVLVAYFGGDLTAKAPWALQNAAFMKRYYGEKVEVLNAGRGNDTSTSGLARYEMDVLKYKPSLVVIEFGFNDARDEAGVSLEDSRTNLKGMIEKTRKLAPDCDIVLVTTHALNVWGEGAQRRSDLGAYYKVVREVAAEEKVGLIDNSPVWDEWAANDPAKYTPLIGPNLLPTAAGQKELSQKAEAYFRQQCARGKEAAAPVPAP